MNTFFSATAMFGRFTTQATAGYAARIGTEKLVKRFAPGSTGKGWKVVRKGAPIIAEEVSRNAAGELYDCALVRAVQAYRKVSEKKKEEIAEHRKGVKVKKLKKAEKTKAEK